MPFRARYNKFDYQGSLHTKGPFTVKSGEAITQGMLCKYTSGEVEPADAGDVFAGWAQSDAAAGDTDLMLYDIDVAMGISDGYARVDGAAIDVASGSQGIEATTKTNYDLVVVESSTATEETRVMVHPKNTLYYTAS